MNLTRVLNVALPDIPARLVGDKPPRFPPNVIWKEHLEALLKATDKSTEK